jgi:DnaJ-class molecular chaperone
MTAKPKKEPPKFTIAQCPKCLGAGLIPSVSGTYKVTKCEWCRGKGTTKMRVS